MNHNGTTNLSAPRSLAKRFRRVGVGAIVLALLSVAIAQNQEDKSVQLSGDASQARGITSSQAFFCRIFFASSRDPSELRPLCAASSGRPRAAFGTLATRMGVRCCS